MVATVVVVLLLIETVLALKPPVNLPSLSLRGATNNRVESYLVPLLQRSLAESRVHLRGKGESLSLLEELEEEMKSGVLSEIDSSWVSLVEPSLVAAGTKWCDLPGKVAESMFYRRLSLALEVNEVTGSDKATFDCFLDNKLSNLRSSQPFLEELAARLPDIVMADDPLEALKMFCFVDLWAMQKERRLISDDPNITGTAMKRRAFSEGIDRQMSYLVKNDCGKILDVFKEGQTARGDVSVVLGSTGKELVADIALAYTLLTLNLCETVTFHTKKYTVSEYGATSVDVFGHIEHLADPVHSDVWAVRHFGEAVRAHIYTGRLRIVEDEFWCLPSPMWEMPVHLETRLADSRLVIVKGDSNYRRMLGDREWPLTTDPASVLGYWHVPVCAIRILESQIGCGLEERTAAFMASGRYGMVQFHSSV